MSGFELAKIDLPQWGKKALNKNSWNGKLLEM